ncbi:MAG TPA: FecR family protein [Povalibacter sp.]|uniref:FecR family protein n=1 Tax=Povalibacter sp. TaxID=1962978 RepID=UPI002C731C20|nr:FecR family protein [Povalibacter sp.]HMN43772.1 FecR family protein [Povalibacter sp.]
MEPTRAMVEQALAWHMRLSESAVAESELESCARWRSEHPAHALAFARMEAISQRFESVRGKSSAAALEAGFSVRSRKRRAARFAAGAGALALYAGAMLTLADSYVGGLSITALRADYRTGAGEQATVDLEDGSRVVLNSRSSVDVSYSGTQRRVVLREGEVLVEVARDAARPFVVETSQGTARALGTRYLVRKADEQTTVVTVLESVVRTCVTPEHDVACVDLHPGEQVKLSGDALHFPVKVDGAAAAGWREGSLLVDDRPLSEVLDELARHRKGRLRYDAAALAGLRVSGVFPLHDTDRALAVIAETQTQPVVLRSQWPWTVRVELREDGHR